MTQVGRKENSGRRDGVKGYRVLAPERHLIVCEGGRRAVLLQGHA